MMIMLAGRIRCDPFGQRPRDHKDDDLADVGRRQQVAGDLYGALRSASSASAAANRA